MTTTPPFIVRSQDYVHYPSGLRLSMNIIVSGTAPPEFARFTTNVVHNVQLPSGEQVQGKIALGIDADTLDEAFEKLPTLIKQAAKRIEADVAKKLRPQIVLPGPPLINRNGGRMR